LQAIEHFLTRVEGGDFVVVNDGDDREASERDRAQMGFVGGPTREYQVQVDPGKLVSYGLSLAQVELALANNNTNAGGGFIERGQQALNVRAVGLMQTTDDIAATVIKSVNGTPVRVRDIAMVVQAPKIRLGQLGKTIRREDGTVIDDEDVVEGIVLLRKGAEADATLDALHAKINELNTQLLPQGVKFVPHLDRSELVHYTTHTVLRQPPPILPQSGQAVESVPRTSRWPPHPGLDAQKTSRCPAREKCFYLTSPLIEPACQLPPSLLPRVNSTGLTLLV
jgi:hypothetical protein